MEENNEQSCSIGEQSEVFCFCSDLIPFKPRQKPYKTILESSKEKLIKEKSLENTSQLKQSKSITVKEYIEICDLKKIHDEQEQDLNDGFLIINEKQILMGNIRTKIKELKSYIFKFEKFESTIKVINVNINRLIGNNEKLKNNCNGQSEPKTLSQGRTC